METDTLQIIFYVLCGLLSLSMITGIVIVATSEKHRGVGVKLILVGMLSILIATIAGFRNYHAFIPERNAVIKHFTDCGLIETTTELGIKNYTMFVNGTKYNVEFSISK
jgi:predicted membrane channel-forming protein YqfA (hemolysin III family)